METSQLLRHQTIKSLLAQHTEQGEDVVTCLWEPLATQVISIVGEGGFNSLQARTLFLSRNTYPWLESNPQPLTADNRFADLKRRFKGQTP